MFSYCFYDETYEDKVFVLECGIKSGIMHTVKYALKMRKAIVVLGGLDSIGDLSGNEEILNNSLGRNSFYAHKGKTKGGVKF